MTYLNSGSKFVGCRLVLPREQDESQVVMSDGFIGSLQSSRESGFDGGRISFFRERNVDLMICRNGEHTQVEGNAYCKEGYRPWDGDKGLKSATEKPSS